MADTHFVPENPDQAPAESRELPLDLAARRAVFGQPTGEDIPGGVRFHGGVTNKAAFPLPFALTAHQSVTVSIAARFDSPVDSAIRLYLTGSGDDVCSANVATIIHPDAPFFTRTVELVADKDCDCVMLASASFADWLDDFTLISLSVDSAVGHVQVLADSVPYDRAVTEPWYQELLRHAQVNLGNNKRLHKLIARARAGEQLTVATIGGSITEGAGADRYRECYAYQIYEGFRQRYGADGGSHVSFVNAGVGGTPSTFGWMRWQRDILDRVQDDDHLPDLVVIEYAVNDGGEPTIHRCYESMVKAILSQPNEPVVILLFSVFPTGYTLQNDFIPLGRAYDLMMVSMHDSAYPFVGTKWTKDAFFFDIYHPTTMGHKVMADCVLAAIEASAALPEAENDVDPAIPPVYGTDFVGMQRIFRDAWPEQIGLSVGAFDADDDSAYKNLPIGRVCGANFHHSGMSPEAPLTFSGTFKNLLIAYRTVTNNAFGRAEVVVDGRVTAVLEANTGSWGQSVVDLVYDAGEAAAHLVEIRMAPGDEGKQFTITCMAFTA